ncbi:predicted protein, partial [Nematostella vectensis]
KEKMNAVKNAIDDAEDREAEAKYHLKEALERGDKAEENIEGMIRRRKLLEDELARITASLDQATQQLFEKRNKTEEEQATEKELGHMELEIDEVLNERECQCKEALAIAEEKHQNYIDACRKHTKAQLDCDRAKERLEKAQERIESLEYDLHRAGETMVELEAKDEVASEREMEREEKIAFLQAELKKLVEREDIAEREVQKLQRIIDEECIEMEQIIEKKESVSKEI